MYVYVLKTSDIYKLINEFCKISGFKVNLKTLIELLHTKSKQLDIEILKIVLQKPQNIKILWKNLNKRNARLSHWREKIIMDKREIS